MGLPIEHALRSEANFGSRNIQVFTLAVIIALCVVLTALDLGLLKCLIFWNKPAKRLFPRIENWIRDGVFQLQYRAYEAHGQGSWECVEKEVSLTTTGIELVELTPVLRSTCNCSTPSSMGMSLLSSITAPPLPNQSQVIPPIQGSIGPVQPQNNQPVPVGTSTQTGHVGTTISPSSTTTSSQLNLASTVGGSTLRNTVRSPTSTPLVSPSVSALATSSSGLNATTLQPVPTATNLHAGIAQIPPAGARL